MIRTMTTLDTTAFTALAVTVEDGIVHARLDRPEVRNAIDAAMIAEFHLLCAHLEAEPAILILSGQDKVFASGADIGQLRQRRRDDALAGINSGAFDRIARLPMPVIAALDGYALGGGAELAWAADFRIGTPRVTIGQPEVGLGIIPAAGALWRLKELLGEAIAKEILLAGRTLDAEEALAHGLVTEIHPPEELIAAATALAGRIAAQDALAVRIAKKVFAMPREAHPHIDDLAQAILFESEGKERRMQAFLDQRDRRRAERDARNGSTGGAS